MKCLGLSLLLLLAPVRSPAPALAVERSPDGRRVSVTLGGREVLRLTDATRLRLRCLPDREQWIGYDGNEVDLGWLPNDAPGTAAESVHVAETATGISIVVAGTKPGLGNARFETTITVDPDGADGARFGIASRLEGATRLPRASTRSGVEFLDLWFERIFGPEREIYQQIVYGSASGVVRAPKLHVFTATAEPGTSFETLAQPLESGSFVALVDDAEPGYVVRIRRLSAPGAVIFCWWAWDPHFYVRESPGALFYDVAIEPLRPDRGRELLARARPIAFESDPDYQLPVFHLDGTNTFDDRIATSDQWAWERLSRESHVDRGSGFDDRASLAISARRGGHYAWYARALYEDPWHQTPIGGRYRLTAKVRTRDVRGQVRIGVVQNDGADTVLFAEPAADVAYSSGIDGTADWTDVAVDFAVTKRRPKVVLELDGRGRAWFDDVRILPLTDPEGDERPVVAFHARGGAGALRLPLGDFETSRPEVRRPCSLALAWRGSWASAPPRTLDAGVYRLVLFARGEGCAADPPVLRIEGPGFARDLRILPDARRDYEVEFSLPRRTVVSFRATLVDDRTCDGKDMNVFVYAATLGR